MITTPQLSGKPGQAPSAATLVVKAETYDGSHTVAATPHLDQQQVLRVGSTGRVTATACSAGTEIDSGTSPLAVDGVPVLALATAEPMYRDLTLHDVGRDVALLQQELNRLGRSAPTDGTFDRRTQRAVKALQASVGITKPSGALPAASVLWLPSPSVTLASCDVQAGDWVTSGDEFGKLAGGLKSLGLVNPPGRGWLAHYGDRSATINDQGVVTDPAFLAAVEAGPELALFQSNPNNGGLQLQIALETPRRVLVVPPAAVIATGEGAGCIVADGTPVRIDIVASSLGQTLVATKDGSTPTEVTVRPEQGLTC